MSAQPVVFYVREDSTPLTFQIDVDLLSLADIRLNVRFQDGTAVRDKSAVFEDVVNGVFSFSFVAGELKAGEHDAELIFVATDLSQVTFPDRQPIRLIVRERVV